VNWINPFTIMMEVEIEIEIEIEDEDEDESMVKDSSVT
jgi:hypothetical protein